MEVGLLFLLEVKLKKIELGMKRVDILARKFEMEMLNKESKYARQGGFITGIKKGMYTQKYRVRATIKLSPSGENLDIKSEAQYGGQSGWKSGFDDRLLQL